MPDIPDAVQPAVRAVLAHPWAGHQRSAHDTHAYDSDCAVCQGDVARMLEVATPVLAAHVLLVAEIGNGLRCPRCHGQPASRRWPSGRIRSYRCGCGYTWDPRSAHQIHYQLSVQQILTELAAGGPMPPTPPKTRCEACETGERHA